VEQYRSVSSYTQIVYSPTGAKLALMSGQTLQKALVPLPGKATAVYTSSGLDHYRHSDWLGHARFASTATRTMYSDVAYAPFGETYAQAGTPDPSFTGENSDTLAGEYDFLAREYGSTQGRWPSPDPGGLASAHLADPRSWNRYAYVRNDPLCLTDPLGLDCVYLNDAGDGVEEVDHNSSLGECAGSGGFWIPGYVDPRSVVVDPNSNWILGQNSLGQQFASPCNGAGCGPSGGPGAIPGWFSCFAGPCGSLSLSIPSGVNYGI
jgi:RHS repeat-associated protein